MFRTQKYLLAILGSLFFVGQAQASLITDWSFSANTAWDTADTVFTSGGGTTINQANLISWGATGGDHTVSGLSSFDSRSAIGIGGSSVNGTVETNGAPATETAVLTHYNNAIRLSFSILESATLVTDLILTPLLPEVGDPLAPLSRRIATSFIETRNTSEIEDCGFETLTRCDDIFVVDATGLSSSFELDGWVYHVNFALGAGTIGTLTDLQCAAAGVDAGCVGFTTPENAQTQIDLALSITAARVPEPNIVALFGLGLLAMGLVRVRRTKKFAV
jgi:hypothetical protein